MSNEYSDTIKPRRYESVRIYRAQKNGNGAASTIEHRVDDNGNVLMFLKMAKQSGTNQNGDATFDWKDTAINVSMSVADAASFLTVINGRTDEKGITLFHQFGDTNKIIKFAPYERGGYQLGVSSKSKNGEGARYSHLLNLAEAEILRVMFEDFIRKSYGWTTP